MAWSVVGAANVMHLIKQLECFSHFVRYMLRLFVRENECFLRITSSRYLFYKQIYLSSSILSPFLFL